MVHNTIRNRDATLISEKPGTTLYDGQVGRGPRVSLVGWRGPPFLSKGAKGRLELDADRAIAVINMEEAFRRRLVRGRDINEWHPTISEWLAAGRDDDVLTLVAEIIDATMILEQYDPREPQPYWFELAARIHHRRGAHRDEAVILRRWLARWPYSRGNTKRRAGILAKAGRAENH